MVVRARSSPSSCRECKERKEPNRLVGLDDFWSVRGRDSEIGEEDRLRLLVEPGPSSPGLDGAEGEDDEKSDGGRSFRLRVDGGAVSGG